MKRPKLQEMLGFIREDDVVYVEEFSRLGELRYDLLSIVKRIENTGAKFVSLKENFEYIDTDRTFAAHHDGSHCRV